jgi:hypothetical protein
MQQLSNSFQSTEQLRKPFVPEEYDLDPGWRLTKYSDLKG